MGTSAIYKGVIIHGILDKSVRTDMRKLIKDILITTIPGLEDVAAEDIQGILKYGKCLLSPYGLRGRVLIRDVKEFDLSKILNVKSIERVIFLLGTTRVGKDKNSLRNIYEYCKEIAFEEFVTPHTRIGVVSQREGEHEYTSLDIAKVVGQAVIDRIIEVYGIRPPVDLEYPDITIYAEVIGDVFIIGIDRTGPKPLHDREYRRFLHPSSLRPTIAYSLVKLSGAKNGELILDPMCGGGTILIEAALQLPRAKLYGMDINPNFVKGAFMNVKAAGVSDRVILKVGDARNLDREFHGFEFDRIITDPPYGIRMRPRGLKRLYERFLQSSLNILKDDGTLTLITIQSKLTLRLAKKLGYEVLHKRTIYQGGLYSHIIVLRKP